MTGLAFPKPRAVPSGDRRRIRAQSKRDSTRLVNWADDLARGLVMRRAAGKCEACGIKVPLDAAHGFGKKTYPAVRFDSRNLYALHRQCHEEYGRSWSTWMHWMVRHLGLKTFEALRASALGTRPDMESIVAGLLVGRFSDERPGA